MPMSFHISVIDMTFSNLEIICWLSLAKNEWTVDGKKWTPVVSTWKSFHFVRYTLCLYRCKVLGHIPAEQAFGRLLCVATEMPDNWIIQHLCIDRMSTYRQAFKCVSITSCSQIADVTENNGRKWWEKNAGQTMVNLFWSIPSLTRPCTFMPNLDFCCPLIRAQAPRSMWCLFDFEYYISVD